MKKIKNHDDINFLKGKGVKLFSDRRIKIKVKDKDYYYYAEEELKLREFQKKMGY